MSRALQPLAPVRALAFMPGAGAVARPLADHVQPFLGWFALVRQRAESTIDAYGRDLRSFITFCNTVGVWLPQDVTFQVIEAYMATIQHERQVGPCTANRHRATIGSLFVYLVRNGFAVTNPVRETFALKEPERIPEYLSIPEQTRVLAALAKEQSPVGRRDHAMIAVGFFAGLRIGEIAMLRIEHLDLESRVLRVVRGKGRKDRELPIVPRLAAILRPYMTNHNARPRLTMGRPVPWVFVNGSPTWTRTRENHPRRTKTRLDQPLCTRFLFQMVRRKVSPIVGRPVHPHMLRHSFGSRLRARGADLQLVQEAMGHASITSTAIYAHLSTPQRLAELTRLLASDD